MQEKSAVDSRAVWARGGVFSGHCPKSVITSQSLYFLDYFQIWKRFGGGSVWSLEAKTADAVLVLEEAYQMEEQRGESE